MRSAALPARPRILDLPEQEAIKHRKFLGFLAVLGKKDDLSLEETIKKYVPFFVDSATELGGDEFDVEVMVAMGRREITRAWSDPATAEKVRRYHETGRL